MASLYYTEQIKRIHNIALYTSSSYRKRRRMDWDLKQKYNLEKYYTIFESTDWKIRNEVKKLMVDINKACNQLMNASEKRNASQINKVYKIRELMIEVNKLRANKV